MKNNKLNDLPEMDLFDVDWIAVMSIFEVDDRNCRIGVMFVNGVSYRVQIPPDLFYAIVRHAEKKFIEEDIERQDEKHSFY